MGRFRRAIVRAAGVSVGRKVRLERGVIARRGFYGRRGEIDIGDEVVLSAGCILDAWGGTIDLKAHVFIGPYTVVYGHGGVVVGENTLIAMHCRILSAEHEIPPVGTNVRSRPDVRKATVIGNDVWLGAGVTVTAGVTIGDCCVVGAGSVVTRDLQAGTIAYGVPARVVGARGGG